MTQETNAAPAEDTIRPEETAAAEEATQPPAEQTDAPDTEGEETTEESAAKEKSEQASKKGAEARIRELTKKYREAERNADYWKRKAEAAPQESAPPEPDPRPNQDNFDSHEEFVEALADWKAQQRINATLQERDQQARTQSETQAKTARMQHFSAQVTKAKAAHPDFDAVAANPQLQVTEPMLDVLQDLEQGAEVLYFLGKNPETAAEIAQIQSPYRLAATLARIEDSLSDHDTTSRLPGKSTPPIQIPPDPPATISGKAEPKPGDGMPIDAWMDRRNKEVGNRR